MKDINQGEERTESGQFTPTREIKTRMKGLLNGSWTEPFHVLFQQESQTSTQGVILILILILSSKPATTAICQLVLYVIFISFPQLGLTPLNLTQPRKKKKGESFK